MVAFPDGFPLALCEQVMGPCPRGDAGEMWSGAAAWSAAGEACRAEADRLEAVAASVPARFGGAAGAELQRLLAGSAAEKHRQADFCGSLAAQCDEAALATDLGQTTWRWMALVLVAELVADMFLAGGAPVAAAAHRAAARAGWRLALTRLVELLTLSGQRFSGSRVALPLGAGVLGAGLGGGITWGAQVWQQGQGRRAEIDWQSVAIAAGGGLAGGVASAGALSLRPVNAVLARLHRAGSGAGTAGAVLFAGGVSGAAGGAGGAVGAAGVASAYAGSWAAPRETEVWTSMVNGVLEGLISGGAHTVHAYRDASAPRITPPGPAGQTPGDIEAVARGLIDAGNHARTAVTDAVAGLLDTRVSKGSTGIEQVIAADASFAVRRDGSYGDRTGIGSGLHPAPAAPSAFGAGPRDPGPATPAATPPAPEPAPQAATVSGATVTPIGRIPGVAADIPAIVGAPGTTDTPATAAETDRAGASPTSTRPGLPETASAHTGPVFDPQTTRRTSTTVDLFVHRGDTPWSREQISAPAPVEPPPAGHTTPSWPARAAGLPFEAVTRAPAYVGTVPAAPILSEFAAPPGRRGVAMLGSAASVARAPLARGSTATSTVIVASPTAPPAGSRPTPEPRGTVTPPAGDAPPRSESEVVVGKPPTTTGTGATRAPGAGGAGGGRDASGGNGGGRAGSGGGGGPDGSGADGDDHPGAGETVRRTVTAILGTPVDANWSSLTPPAVGAKLLGTLEAITRREDFRIFGFDRGVVPEVAQQFAVATVELVRQFPLTVRGVGIAALDSGRLAMVGDYVDPHTGIRHPDMLILDHRHAADAQLFASALVAGVADDVYSPTALREPVFHVVAHAFGRALYDGSMLATSWRARAYLRNLAENDFVHARWLNRYSPSGSGESDNDLGEGLGEAFAVHVVHGAKEDSPPEPVRKLYDLLTRSAGRSSAQAAGPTESGELAGTAGSRRPDTGPVVPPDRPAVTPSTGSAAQHGGHEDRRHLLATPLEGAEQQRSYRKDDYARMWEREIGRTLTRRELTILESGCVGVVRLRLGSHMIRPPLNLAFYDHAAHLANHEVERVLAPAEVNRKLAGISEEYRSELEDARSRLRVEGGARTFERVAAYAERFNAILARNPDDSQEFLRLVQADEVLAKLRDVGKHLPGGNPSGWEAVIFSKQYWSGQAPAIDAGGNPVRDRHGRQVFEVRADPDGEQFVPDPETGQVTMAVDTLLPKPGYGNYNFAWYDSRTGSWWYANHMEHPDPAGRAADPMIVYQSSPAKFFAGWPDYDSQVLCIGFVERTQPPPTALEAVSGTTEHPGQDLRALRAASGLTQTEMAKRAGMSQQSINRYESGSAPAPVHVVEAYRRAAVEAGPSRARDIAVSVVHLDNRELGARLGRLRTTAGLTQTEMAVRAGTYQDAVSRFERGARRPPAEVIAAYLDLLDDTHTMSEVLGSRTGAAPAERIGDRSSDGRRLLGAELRGLRRHRGLTQAELADRLGVDRSTISTWETGLSRPSPHALRALIDKAAIPAETVNTLYRQHYPDTAHGPLIPRVEDPRAYAGSPAGLGRWFRDVREWCGATPEGFARLAGTTAETISEREAGRRQPSVEELRTFLGKIVPLTPSGTRDTPVLPTDLLARMCAHFPTLEPHVDAPDTYLEWAGWLRGLRARSGTSQLDFARLLGVGKGTVWAWEIGRYHPRLQNLRTLRDATGMSSGTLRAAMEHFSGDSSADHRDPPEWEQKFWDLIATRPGSGEERRLLHEITETYPYTIYSTKLVTLPEFIRSNIPRRTDPARCDDLAQQMHLAIWRAAANHDPLLGPFERHAAATAHATALRAYHEDEYPHLDRRTRDAVVAVAAYLRRHSRSSNDGFGESEIAEETGLDPDRVHEALQILRRGPVVYTDSPPREHYPGYQLADSSAHADTTDLRVTVREALSAAHSRPDLAEELVVRCFLDNQPIAEAAVELGLERVVAQDILDESVLILREALAAGRDTP
ncbi:helix-turn-helix domain-containing protein [Nocardia sp. NPDC024068]|uniref:helix-turn-helix domain-containing protein n=1 Tax=Nocardia sp. NPDC024068 TaxID=3157197 RepID=UPI0033FF3DBC